MLKKTEFENYKAIVESKSTMDILASMDPDAISKLGGEMSAYYARISNELAVIKDKIMKEVFRLSQQIDEKGKAMAIGRAEVEAEVNVNAKQEVTRREAEYLMNGIDKIAFACSARVRSFNKEGSF